MSLLTGCVQFFLIGMNKVTEGEISDADILWFEEPVQRCFIRVIHYDAALNTGK